jgi:hypothetical protein
VLVSGAALPPPEELPEGLRPLARRQAFPLPDESFRSQAQVLVERLRPVVAPATPGTPRGPEPAWSVELVDTSARQRVLRVRLTHAQYLVTCNYGFWSVTLLVDDVVVARKSWKEGTAERGTANFELQFQLSDGDATRPCTFLVSGGLYWITRAVLTVDGRLLYDEGQPQASPT